MVMKSACLLVLLSASIHAASVKIDAKPRVASGSYIDVSGRQLFVGTDWVGAPDASAQCDEIGMKIISFDDPNEYLTLLTYLRDNNYMYQWFWTSGIRRAGETMWYWNATNSFVTGTFWAFQQPNDAIESASCIQFTVEPQTDSLWYDKTCEDYIPFICE